MRIQVYTAITGAFEPKREDCVVFSAYDRFTSPRMNAKIYKCLPHIFCPEADITIWLDGNIRFSPGVDIGEFVTDFLGEADMAVFKHPYRENIYQEADVCIQSRLDDPQTIMQQMVLYNNYKFQGSKYFAECGLIVRRNRGLVNRFNETWWAHISAFSSRDQLSFPFAVAKHPMLRVKLHKGNVREDERFIYSKRQSSRP